MLSDSTVRAYPGTTPRLRDGAAFCLGVFLVARLALSLTAAVGVPARPPDPSALAPLSPPTQYTVAATPGWHNAYDGMDRWDAAWFEWVAAEGYGPGDDVRPAFFPGYPLLISLASTLTGSGVATVAIVISNIAYLASLIAMFALTSAEFGRRDARWAVALFAAMPTSFFFLAPYSESLFLLCTLFAFVWSRSERWWLGSLAGIAAGLTRPMAVALIPALALIAHKSRDRSRIARVLLVASPALGSAMYAAWWAVFQRNPGAPAGAQAYWGRALSFAPATIVRGLNFAMLAASRGIRTDLAIDGVFIVFLICTAILAIRHVPRAYGAYIWATLAIPLTFPWPSRPFLSIPRLACVLFPLSWTWVRTLRKDAFLWTAVAVFGASQIALASIFMNWGWIF